jgi:hypothetical protein
MEPVNILHPPFPEINRLEEHIIRKFLDKINQFIITGQAGG